MADTEDTETLAELLDHEPIDLRGDDDFIRLAQRLLASSWLAARDERIRADEREKLAGQADRWERERSCEWGCEGEMADDLRKRLAGEVDAR